MPTYTFYDEKSGIEWTESLSIAERTKFLDDNIYKIEKMIKNFISNIILIIEDDKVLDVCISFKKKNYENFFG